MRIHPRYTQRGAVAVLGGATVLTLMILSLHYCFHFGKRSSRNKSKIPYY